MTQLLHPTEYLHQTRQSVTGFLKSCLLLFFCFVPMGLIGQTAANPITDENALVGQATGWADWDATNRLVEAYASEVSLVPGATLHLHVSTKPSASYRVDLIQD